MTAKVILRTKTPRRVSSDRSPRRRVELPGEASTTTRILAFTLRNLSCTGAMAEGEEIPPADRDLVLRVGGLELLCRVVWTQERRCGLEFDEPLAHSTVVALSQIVPAAVDERAAGMIAAEAWARPQGRSAFLD